ncbi:hypothetical protein MYX75_01110 [Acidobacteria bacterium AH-259-A15]|nr:hypothetical protein [Acidobacteria bacterium AH-259-A15]
MKRLTIPLLLLLCLSIVFAGCANRAGVQSVPPEVNVVRLMDGVADSVMLLQSVTFSAEENGLISPEVARNIVESSLKISLSQREAIQAMRRIDELGDQGVPRILNLIDILAHEIDNAITIAGLIEDAATEKVVLAALRTARISVLTVKEVLR